MVYSLSHITEYEYEDTVSYCHNIAILKPRATDGQQLIDFKLNLDPQPEEVSETIDYFGNHIHRFSIQHQHKKLKVVSKSKVKRESKENTYGVISAITLKETKEILAQNKPDILNAKQFALESPLIRKMDMGIRNYAHDILHEDQSLYDGAFNLMQRIYNDFEYVPGYTNIATPINEVIIDRKGVCQDFAQMAIACLRSVGMPARYVSGYLETLPPPGQEKLVGADASHAWFSVFIPGMGWVDFDPTNNKLASEQYITLAWGRDYYDVPPLKGVIYTNGDNTMKVSVDLRPVEGYY